MNDPLRQAIENALSGRLDPEKFQKCAVELLRAIYPSIVLISGGRDFGRDALVAPNGQDPFPLLCTISANALKNLHDSLSSYSSYGAKGGPVIVATPKKVSPIRRRNLERAAREHGFTLLNVYDQSWFSPALYYDASWRMELLGITGKPSALSQLPKSRRQHVPGILIGRDKEEASLRKSGSDLVIYGEPGVGKTVLLQELAESDWGLFLVEFNDSEALADAIRNLNPTRIIVDDAHFKPGVLEALRHLRALQSYANHR